MNTELHYSWAKPDDLAEVEAFIAKAFGPDSFQALGSRVRWLYFDNPLGIHVAFCRHQGELVAICPHVPQMVKVGEREIMAAFGVDFFVMPAWRRQGIGQQFLSMRLERFPLSLSTGQSPSMSALYQRLGAKDLGAFQIGYFRNRPPWRGCPRQLLRGWLAWLQGTTSLHVGVCSNLLTNPVTDAMTTSENWHHWRFAGITPYRDHTAVLGSEPGQTPLSTRGPEPLPPLCVQRE